MTVLEVTVLVDSRKPVIEELVSEIFRLGTEKGWVIFLFLFWFLGCV